MSSPAGDAGFYYDPSGNIRPRRYFDHEGRPLPGNTTDTSYAPIPGSSPLHSTDPINTRPKQEHNPISKRRKDRPPLRLSLLRKKAKRACTNAIKLAKLVAHLQETIDMRSASHDSTAKSEPSSTKDRQPCGGSSSPTPPLDPRCRARSLRATSQPIWKSLPPPDLPEFPTTVSA
ncbi:hypothetical protein QR685DRAFT_542677 [Neurospora intermedia]|uniref:Uncharacterized protein n=1 Tax=Neurospora intermedia TaxID=5142 RepID=A0ABR3DFB0_NEUIN